MKALQRFGMFVACLVFLAPQGSAQDLARYRDFEFGMTADSVMKQAKAEPSDIKTVFTKPNLIQTLQWNRQDFFPAVRPDATDPVRSIRFDFYEGRLFRIVAIYGTKQLEGMSSDDLVEGISKSYGPPSMTGGNVVVSSYADYEDEQKVLARWENSENAHSLFRSSYRDEFGLVAYSKKIEMMATGSIVEARRLETAAAPQREADRQQKEIESRRVAEEKARSVNKPNFRP